jgi:hypothetical protein
MRLPTTRIVRKNPPTKHRRQKFAAVREFRQHGVILQLVRRDGPGSIVILALRDDNTFRLRQICTFTIDQQFFYRVCAGQKALQ